MTTSRRWSLLAAILGTGIVFLDSTVVTVALQRIGADLPTSVLGTFEAQSYVYNGYLLALASLLILAGAITDTWGVRRSFAVGLGGFAAASALCGLASSMEMLVVFRILQGAAGALVVPGSLAIIKTTFTEEEQGRAFGLWAGASAITSIVGPFVGGLLVDSISWRAAFLLNLPLAALALWATVAHVTARSQSVKGRHLDWIGAALVAAAMGGLAFGAIRGQESRWTDPGSFVGLAAGGIATVLVPIWLVRARRPLVPPELFRSRTFTVVNVITLAVYGALYVAFYVLAIYLQGTLGYDATAAGLAQVPSMVFLAAFAARFGALAVRHGSRWFMTVGAALMGAGLVWQSLIGQDSAPWRVTLSDPRTLVPPLDAVADVLLPMALYGVGLMLLVAPLTTALMRSVPERRSGIASAFNNAVSRIGPQLAGALVFVVVSAQFFAALGDLAPGLDVASPEVRATFSVFNEPGPAATESQRAAAREASTKAFRLAMLVSAGLLFAGASVAAFGIEDRPGVETTTAPVAPPAVACPPVEVGYAPDDPAP